MNTSGFLSRLQWFFLSGCLGLFALLYWGFDTKPSDFRIVERDRALTLRNTDVSTLIAEARPSLSVASVSVLSEIEHQLEMDLPNSEKTALLKELAGHWYELGYPSISGAYAEQIGEVEGTAAAWSIAGSTYYSGIEKESSEKSRQFSRDGAIRCFEKAVSLEPENPDHHLNLSLTYTAAPPSDNPMKGVLMLRSLTERFPQHSPVYTQLGRLAIQTGQYDRAAERLQQAIDLDPENIRAICLLADTWDKLGNTERASALYEQCNRNAR
jgi:tetratricopeptide (TPR) repeat protein